jgi:hypothetical protein
MRFRDFIEIFLLINLISNRYLPHTIVIATAISLPDVFIKPNIFQGDLQFMNGVRTTQQSRMKFDTGTFSDCMASIRISFSTSVLICK